MGRASIPSHLSQANASESRRRAPQCDFDMALCGQCSVCQRYFPYQQIYALQLQQNGVYQDTGRLICFECQRGINPRAYQARELRRDEVAAALRQWLVRYQWYAAASIERAHHV